MRRRSARARVAADLGQARPGLLLGGLLLLAVSACSPATPRQPIPAIATTPAPLGETPQIRRVTPKPSASIPPRPSATPDDRSPQPTASATSPIGPGQAVSEIDGARLVRVAGGPFWMGSAESEVLTEPDEFPQRRVDLQPFWIDQTEVTNRQYALCVRAGGCDPPPALLEVGDDLPYYGDEAFDEYPVANVAWSEAEAYCRWAGRRLPTEAEWERAARGRDSRTYPWGWFGMTMPDRLNFCDLECPYSWPDAQVRDGHARTAPVGSFPKGASPYGALDMAGNVWEWVSDWYDSSAYASQPADRPAGPADGRYKVVRGGSWLDGALGDRLSFFRVANRHWQPPEARLSYLGFRCASSDSPQDR
jgi:formylglycine-generating enzyme required for sulfatase activity